MSPFFLPVTTMLNFRSALTLSFSFIALPFSAFANEGADPELIERLLTERTEASFAAALEEGKKANLPAQVLLEARFLYLVDKQDNRALAALAPELQAANPAFDPALSAIFTLKEDWLAITEYTLALGALEKGNAVLFKKHITEAFWLSPRQAGAFASHIDQFRLTESMRALTLDTTIKLPNLLNKEQTALFKQDSKATLVYFWSPWSREFANELESFKALSKKAKAANIHFLAILVEKSEEVSKDARLLIEEEKLTNTAVWCSDTDALTLSSKLRVQSSSTAVLLSNKGKVLFNNHPASPELEKSIKALEDE